MDALEALKNYLIKNPDNEYYDAIFSLIRDRIVELDKNVPKLLNKAFNHRYTISRIEKAKLKEQKGFVKEKPNYEEQLEDQYRQISTIQQKMREMKDEYKRLKKSLNTIHFLYKYHLEIQTTIKHIPTDDAIEIDFVSVEVSYLLNKEYEQKLISSYQAGLKKENLNSWSFHSLDEIKPPLS